MQDSSDLRGATTDLLASVKAFLFPNGEDHPRRVLAIDSFQRGEMCSAPGAKWTEFVARERTSATESSFRWEARYGKSRLTPILVTDAYENGHGSLTVKLGGLIPVKSFS